MQTSLPQSLLATVKGQEADSILRRCVHCGFCTATCPTYQLLGDELDGPRGRIYLIKQFLEGSDVTRLTQKHLDRCLLCRACETTCPSGVDYGQLLELGRAMVNETVTRPITQRLFRRLLLAVLPFPQRISKLITLARILSVALPRTLRKQLFLSPKRGRKIVAKHKRKILLLGGCVQSSLAPGINESLIRVFDKLNIGVIIRQTALCCGAIAHHLNDEDLAKKNMRATVDAWWPYIDDVEAIMSSATGCAVMLKDYENIFRDDLNYVNKAKAIVSKIKDPVELLQAEDLSRLGIKQPKKKIAYHSPCTQQHGLKQKDIVETLLTRAGFKLTSVKNSHLCCGSAGTYSLLQPEISTQLKRNKLESLQHAEPALIITANIGCMTHLASESTVPVKHWIELLDSL